MARHPGIAKAPPETLEAAHTTLAEMYQRMYVLSQHGVRPEPGTHRHNPVELAAALLVLLRLYLPRLPYWRTMLYQRKLPSLRWYAAAVLDLVCGSIYESVATPREANEQLELLFELLETQRLGGRGQPCTWLIGEVHHFMTANPIRADYLAKQSKTYPYYGRSEYAPYSHDIHIARHPELTTQQIEQSMPAVAASSQSESSMLPAAPARIRATLNVPVPVATLPPPQTADEAAITRLLELSQQLLETCQHMHDQMRACRQSATVTTEMAVPQQQHPELRMAVPGASTN